MKTTLFSAEIPNWINGQECPASSGDLIYRQGHHRVPEVHNSLRSRTRSGGHKPPSGHKHFIERKHSIKTRHSASAGKVSARSVCRCKHCAEGTGKHSIEPRHSSSTGKQAEFGQEHAN